MKKGYSLNEYSLTRVKDGKDFFCHEEREVYEKLGLPFIPPELREDRGEFERDIPRLIELSDIRGDLQMHTTWSDGETSIEEMARAAQGEGLRIHPHHRSLAVAGRDQWPDAGTLEAAAQRDRRGECAWDWAFASCKAPRWRSRPMASLDYPDEVLASLDIVLASLHTSLRQEHDKVTQRALNAIRNPHVDIFAHPTGRLNFEAGDPKKAREGADLDMEAIIAACKETGTILEINASPERLDLNDLNARRALDVGCTARHLHRCAQPGDVQQHALRRRDGASGVGHSRSGGEHLAAGETAKAHTQLSVKQFTSQVIPAALPLLHARSLPQTLPPQTRRSD